MSWVTETAFADETRAKIEVAHFEIFLSDRRGSFDPILFESRLFFFNIFRSIPKPYLFSSG